MLLLALEYLSAQVKCLPFPYEKTHSAKEAFMQKFAVPCQDSIAARNVVANLSGRLAATQRREALHRRKHAATSQLDLSLWLDNEELGVDYDWEGALSGSIRREENDISGTVERIGEVFEHPKSKRVSQTFRISYYRCRDGQRRPIGMEAAKRIHQHLIDRIPSHFEGVKCR